MLLVYHVYGHEDLQTTTTRKWASFGTVRLSTSVPSVYIAIGRQGIHTTHAHICAMLFITQCDVFESHVPGRYRASMLLLCMASNKAN